MSLLRSPADIIVALNKTIKAFEDVIQMEVIKERLKEIQRLQVLLKNQVRA